METASEHSTNSTASNLPGLGRTLDHYLGIIGRRLEKWMAEKAHVFGFGPCATMARLELEVSKFDAKSKSPQKEELRKRIVKDCCKLLKYMQRYESSLDLCDK